MQTFATREREGELCSVGKGARRQLEPPLSGRSNLRRDVERQAGRRRADSKAAPTHLESQRLTGKEQRPGGTYDEFLRPFERLMRESGDQLVAILTGKEASRKVASQKNPPPPHEMVLEMIDLNYGGAYAAVVCRSPSKGVEPGIDAAGGAAPRIQILVTETNDQAKRAFPFEYRQI